jgi:anti-sigma B factor antagonist
MSCFFVISDEITGGNVAVIAMGGEIDFAASPQLREHLFAHIDAGRTRIVLDLSSATFIDSTAIGVLMGALTRLHTDRGGSLAVVCGDGGEELGVTWANETNRIREIFRITGLDGDIALCGSREEALRELALAG